MVLQEFQLDITPVLTGAGIVGLAVGFGAQTLVRDIISGFFLILEDQVRVGDEAAINGTRGAGGGDQPADDRAARHRGDRSRLPERRDQHAGEPKQGLLVLRHRSGGVVLRRCRSRRGSAARGRARSCSAIPRSARRSSSRLRSSGSTAFADWSARMKVRIKTVPLKQWEVGRELRRRILKAFRQHGFAIPFPVPHGRAAGSENEHPAQTEPQSSPRREAVFSSRSARRRQASALSTPGRS